MKIRSKLTKKPRIEIIPMIDVIFFLLVFFMISSLAVTKINSIPVQLPKTSSNADPISQDLILTIKKDGSLYINQIPTSLENLGSVLGYEMHKQPQSIVIVNADKSAPYGLIIQAMNEARKIGVRKFALATQVFKKEKH